MMASQLLRHEAACASSTPVEWWRACSPSDQPTARLSSRITESAKSQAAAAQRLVESQPSDGSQPLRQVLVADEAAAARDHQ
eukprot:1934352-Pyramimonas_sp.AAC.1